MTAPAELGFIGPRVTGSGICANALRKQPLPYWSMTGWRIIRRMVMTDWFRRYPDSADWEAGMLGLQAPMGGRFPDDPSYSLIALK